MDVAVVGGELPARLDHLFAQEERRVADLVVRDRFRDRFVALFERIERLVVLIRPRRLGYGQDVAGCIIGKYPLGVAKNT